ncbi:MAG: reverse transcriptase family protein [Candidatus Thiodiazotropha sp.]
MYKAKIEEGKDDPRSIWKIFREFGASSKCENREIFEINLNDRIVSNEVDIANAFNTYFATVASQLKEPIKASNFSSLKEHINSNVPSDTFFDIPEINTSFVRKFLTTLDCTKATGLDDIGPRLLKIAPDILSGSIAFIVNKSLISGIFPDIWKEAKVNPVFKSGSKDDVNNYRPISILPTLSKLIEKWINTKFMSFLNGHKLFHQRQSGFRSGHSTESALTLMIDSWLKAINDGKLVGCVMVDFRKAFDLVDHKILMHKLRLYKCSEKALSWFESYLTNRNQSVIISGTKSSKEPITYGVPQGSILGPLLFLIFINDLPLELKNTVASTDLYADDTTLYDVQLDRQILENNLQHALNVLDNWCKENGMVLNTDKTKVMLITSRQKRANLKDKNISLKYNDFDLKITCSDKILGVHIDENLMWNDQFQFLTRKVSSNLWLLSQIRSYLSIEHRLLFYNAYIKTHFDYCSIIWGNSSNINLSKITKLQRRACKIILGSEYTNLEEARARLKILSFDESVFLQKAKTMYKIVYDIAPQYLSDLFQLRGTNANDTVNLRSISNMNLIIPKPKINLFKNSLSYSGALVWNSIPLEIKKAPTLKLFVNRCTNWLNSEIF